MRRHLRGIAAASRVVQCAGREVGWHSQLDELLSDPVLKDVDAEKILVEGEPASEIAQGAIDHDVDLITVVMRDGIDCRERLEVRLLRISLLKRRVQCFAFDRRRGLCRPESNPLKRLLLATNFRPSSAAATQLATQIANHMGAELHAVYVIGDYFEQISVIFPEGGLAALTRLRSYVQERMAQLTRTVPRTLPKAARIRRSSKIADTLQADLIVIGTAVHGSLLEAVRCWDLS
jgi:nucleotide-binding universal stress UspA family protein